ncbi:hypothetical protein R3P38DRAFT_2765957 [Favolaschia claudopus]|uniref:Uncharacterized protein n=1 Tax=Favolaschia claudopus TaxID=2862362 RepID=A0AAW0D1D0_9AGAR
MESVSMSESIGNENEVVEGGGDDEDASKTKVLIRTAWDPHSDFLKGKTWEKQAKFVVATARALTSDYGVLSLAMSVVLWCIIRDFEGACARGVEMLGMRRGSYGATPMLAHLPLTAAGFVLSRKHQSHSHSIFDVNPSLSTPYISVNVKARLHIAHSPLSQAISEVAQNNRIVSAYGWTWVTRRRMFLVAVLLRNPFAKSGPRERGGAWKIHIGSGATYSFALHIAPTTHQMSLYHSSLPILPIHAFLPTPFSAVAVPSPPNTLPLYTPSSATYPPADPPEYIHGYAGLLHLHLPSSFAGCGRERLAGRGGGDIKYRREAGGASGGEGLVRWTYGYGVGAGGLCGQEGTSGALFAVTLTMQYEGGAAGSPLALVSAEDVGGLKVYVDLAFGTALLIFRIGRATSLCSFVDPAISIPHHRCQAGSRLALLPAFCVKRQVGYTVVSSSGSGPGPNDWVSFKAWRNILVSDAGSPRSAEPYRNRVDLGVGVHPSTSSPSSSDSYATSSALTTCGFSSGGGNYSTYNLNAPSTNSLGSEEDAGGEGAFRSLTDLKRGSLRVLALGTGCGCRRRVGRRLRDEAEV